MEALSSMDTEEGEEALGLEFVKVTEVDRVLGFCERKRKREEMGFWGVEIGESGRMCEGERVAIDEFFFTVVSVCFSRAVRKVGWVMRGSMMDTQQRKDLYR